MRCLLIRTEALDVILRSDKTQEIRGRDIQTR
jgi:hypothetical protein